MKRQGEREAFPVLDPASWKAGAGSMDRLGAGDALDALHGEGGVEIGHLLLGDVQHGASGSIS